MKIVVFILCIILVFISNIICIKLGIKYGIEYSLPRTYNIFMKAIHTKLKKDNKSDEEIEKFMKNIDNLLIPINKHYDKI